MPTARCGKKGATLGASKAQGTISAEQTEAAANQSGKVSVSAVINTRELLDKLDRIPKPPRRSLERRTSPDKKRTITLNIRSPEGVLYYLGEVVRRHLDPEFAPQPGVVQIPFGPADTSMPRSPLPLCGVSSDGKSRSLDNIFHCENIFLVDEGANHSHISVDYDGRTYWLHDEPRKAGKTGWSLSTLAFVKQLINLNSSVKDFPPLSPVAVVAGP
jgi:hypothetical protein